MTLFGRCNRGSGWGTARRGAVSYPYGTVSPKSLTSRTACVRSLVTRLSLKRVNHVAEISLLRIRRETVTGLLCAACVRLCHRVLRINA